MQAVRSVGKSPQINPGIKEHGNIRRLRRRDEVET